MLSSMLHLMMRTAQFPIWMKLVSSWTPAQDLTALVGTECPISLVLRQTFFHFQNNNKTLDLSYKMDLDFWHCYGREKPILLVNFGGLI